MKTYYVLSGEGDFGTWSAVDTDDIESYLDDERCHGDRWASALDATSTHETCDGQWAAPDIHSGEPRLVPDYVVEGVRLAHALGLHDPDYSSAIAACQ